MADTPREKRTVLLLDGDQASALAITRSLGRRGVRVHVGERGDERSGPFLSGLSKWAAETFRYPDPLTDARAFVEAIRERVQKNAYDLVIPVTDDTVQPLAAAREAIEKHARLAVAPNAALRAMTAKDETFAIAEKTGVPVPRTWTITNAAEARELSKSLVFPVVIKPARSIVGEKSRTKLVVRYAHDAREFTEIAGKTLDSGAALIQEYVTGTGVGVEVLADRGEIIYAFAHERLHEMPLTGGGSCLRRSIAVDPQLLDYSKRLLGAVGWHGVAMVEFKHDRRTGAAWLMEVNGRFWGSLPLAVAAGADFPWLLLEWLTVGKAPALLPYKTGVKARKLYFDVFWTIEVLRRADPNPLIRWPSRIGALLSWFGIFSPSHVFDVQSFADPAPGRLDLSRLWRALTARIRERRQKRQALAAAESLRKNRAALAERAARAEAPLFLCYGNINRSALAERVFRTLAPPAIAERAASAGFHREAGRPADPGMIRAAETRGYDLAASRSRTIDAAALDRADIVFAMDASHLMRLAEEYPAAAKKAVLLGAFVADPAWPIEIADPYGGTPDDYARCAEHVESAVRSLAEVLRANRQGGA